MSSGLQHAPDIVTKLVRGQPSGKAVRSKPRGTQGSITEEVPVRYLRKMREICLLEVLECLTFSDGSS